MDELRIWNLELTSAMLDDEPRNQKNTMEMSREYKTLTVPGLTYPI
jgi:hypothetical protein